MMIVTTRGNSRRLTNVEHCGSLRPDRHKQVQEYVFSVKLAQVVAERVHCKRAELRSQ